MWACNQRNRGAHLQPAIMCAATATTNELLAVLLSLSRNLILSIKCPRRVITAAPSHKLASAFHVARTTIASSHTWLCARKQFISRYTSGCCTCCTCCNAVVVIYGSHFTINAKSNFNAGAKPHLANVDGWATVQQTVSAKNIATVTKIWDKYGEEKSSLLVGLS